MARVFKMVASAVFTVVMMHAGEPGATTGKPSVGVYLDFDSSPGPVAVESMKKEVDDILKPSGVALDWRLIKQNHGHEVFDGLVVLKFRGQCQIQSWTTPQPDLAQLGETETLGATKVMKGRVLPFTEVECDKVKEALAYLRSDQKNRQQAYGIALGRVVAHELYHILARTTGHALAGLAKATESLEDLIAPATLAFRQEDSSAIRNSLVSH